jgi:flagellar biosynthesis/type III secretory pathway M-ring protein FliF/YscJ
MNDALRSSLGHLKQLGSGSKAVAALVVLALLLVAGAGAYVARRPHFEMLYARLDAHEVAKVTKALSDAGIRFELSQAPEPFVLYVDSSERHAALMAVAGAGALAGMPGGIPSGTVGVAEMFLSAGEREQSMRKREWEETERLLEGFDFVSEASVRTAPGERTPFGRTAPTKASVALKLRGNRSLSREQSQTVANTVRFALDIEPENLVISDHLGNAIHDGRELAESRIATDMLSYKSQYDSDLAAGANALLAEILGANKARVVVNSEWDHDQSATISESRDPKGVIVSERSSTTETPQGMPESGAGGPAGTASNLAEGYGTEHASLSGATNAPEAAPSAPVATTSERSTEYAVGSTTSTKVRTAPVLSRLSVSFFLDESLSERQPELEASVKAAVGFDEERKDVFSAVRLPFAPPADPAVSGNAGEGAAIEEGGGASSLVPLLLENGVQVLAALAFLFVLMRALKSSSAALKAKNAARAQGEDAYLDELARAQIDELIRSDPDRVGEILSQWAREERVPARSAS